MSILVHLTGGRVAVVALVPGSFGPAYVTSSFGNDMYW